MGVIVSCFHMNNNHDRVLVTKMDLSHCGLTEIPYVVFDAARYIDTLNVSCNRILSLPPQFFQCQELKYLNLNDNSLTSIPPAIGSFLNLISLKLDKNSLKELPESLKTCRKLKRLSLSSNQWKQMPTIITQLINLEELYINDGELNFLPASVGRLTKLKILELRNNNLCTLPLSLSRLSSLVRLDIGDNEFNEFPACINNLKSLTELLIDNNDVEEITDVKNLINLEHLDASYNHISNISDTIGFCTNLSLLNLSFNYIEQLPDTVGNIAQLQTLQLEMNELTEIPKSIGQLSNLEDLNLCYNRLCNIPNVIGLLRKLRSLNVSRNLIEEFPIEIGSCAKLAIINASYNRLQVLPSEIGYLNNLKVLDLVGNFLMYLPITIINLKGIRAIWLSANQNIPLIPFTEDLNIASGERFLTNIALPQLGEISFHNQTNHQEPIEKPSSWSKKIRFAEDEDILPGKLHRTPTPFPKELRAPNRRHHVRNDEQRPNDNYVNVINGEISEQEPVLHPPTDPVTKTGSGLLDFTESCVTMIREANIRRNPKDVAEETYVEESNSRQIDYVGESNGADLNGNENDVVDAVRNVNGERKDENVETATGNNDFHMYSQRNDNLEYSSIRNSTDAENKYSHKRDISFNNSNEASQNSHSKEQIIYSNLIDHSYVKDDQNNRMRSDYYKREAQAIREMYHNDIVYESCRNFDATGNSRSSSRNAYFETNKENQQKYLSENVYSLSPSERKECVPPSPRYEPGKRDMASLTEKMRSQNISPPCYEIAKMYSTKAALFEHHRQS